MAVFRTIAQARASYKKRMRKAIKEAKNGAAKASIYFQGQLKQTAPQKSRKLVNSVRRRPTKNGYSVNAGYSNRGYPVGRFINQEITSRGKTYPHGFRATGTLHPWFTKNKKKTIARYRASYKRVRMALRG
jgi:hypothetical protein